MYAVVSTNERCEFRNFMDAWCYLLEEFKRTDQAITFCNGELHENYTPRKMGNFTLWGKQQ